MPSFIIDIANPIVASWHASRRALIETYNPCMHDRVIVDSIDVVSRLEAIFVCFDPHG